MNRLLRAILLLAFALPALAQVAVPESPRKRIGSFSNLRTVEETGDVLGTRVVLFQDGTRYFGYFTDAEGQARTAPIEHVTFDAASGRLTFESVVVVTTIQSVPEQTQSAWFFQAAGVIDKDGLRLRVREFVLDAGSKEEDRPWEPSFDGLPEQFLPREKTDSSEETPLSYLAWRLETEPHRFDPETEKTQDPAPAQARAAAPSPSLASYATWTRAITPPVIILLFAAFVTGALACWAMVRVSRRSS